MKKHEIELFKRLISSIQGAPFPSTVKDELYDIWYQNAFERANDALAYLNQIPEAKEASADFNIDEELS